MSVLEVIGLRAGTTAKEEQLGLKPEIRQLHGLYGVNSQLIEAGFSVEAETDSVQVLNPQPRLSDKAPDPFEKRNAETRIDLAAKLGEAAVGYTTTQMANRTETEVKFSRFGGLQVAYEGLIALKNSFGSIKEAMPMTELKSAAETARETVNTVYETAKNNKRKAALGAAGLALAGVAYKYAPDMFNSHTHEQAQSTHIQHQVTAPETTVHQHVAVQAQYHLHKAAHRAIAVKEKTQQVKESLRYYGDTVWSHARSKVHSMYPRLSSQKLDQLTNQYSHMILRVNHIKDATKMHVGQFFQMPKLHLK